MIINFKLKQHSWVAVIKNWLFTMKVTYYERGLLKNRVPVDVWNLVFRNDYSKYNLKDLNNIITVLLMVDILFVLGNNILCKE